MRFLLVACLLVLLTSSADAGIFGKRRAKSRCQQASCSATASCPSACTPCPASCSPTPCVTNSCAPATCATPSPCEDPVCDPACLKPPYLYRPDCPRACLADYRRNIACCNRKYKGYTQAVCKQAAERLYCYCIGQDIPQGLGKGCACREPNFGCGDVPPNNDCYFECLTSCPLGL